jgi:hypothetical protein
MAGSVADADLIFPELDPLLRGVEPIDLRLRLDAYAKHEALLYDSFI